MSKNEEVGPLSQAAVASFVFANIQVLVTLAYLAISSTLNQITSSLATVSTPAPNDSIGMFFLVLNSWGFLGLITGVGAVVSTNKGKSGDALGVFGIGVSLLCFVLPFLSSSFREALLLS